MNEWAALSAKAPYESKSMSKSMSKSVSMSMSQASARGRGAGGAMVSDGSGVVEPGSSVVSLRAAAVSERLQAFVPQAPPRPTGYRFPKNVVMSGPWSVATATPTPM